MTASAANDTPVAEAPVATVDAASGPDTAVAAASPRRRWVTLLPGLLLLAAGLAAAMLAHQLVTQIGVLT